MKRKLNLVFATSLLLSSSMSILALTINHHNMQNNKFIKTTTDSNMEVATKYANETSIVAKSLLIGKNKGFSTNNLLNNMFYQSQPDINNLTGKNTGNDFIDDWTSKLDGNSINNIQSLFQRRGINQSQVDAISNNIKNYNSYHQIVPTVKSYLNNSILSNSSTVNLVDTTLKSIKTLVPNIEDYLFYSKYIPLIITTMKELSTNWAQENDFSGNSRLAKMEDYMSKNATFAQAWNIPKHEQWYYVKSRATNWDWNQFYQYIAGVNFNYMFKLISGKYLGEMITDNISYTLGVPSGFNSDNFNTNFITIFNKILSNPEALPYLVRTIIPLLKTEVLKLPNPTLSIDNITWDDKNITNSSNSLQLKQILTIFQNLISSKADLLKLVTHLMTGPFGEDIIAKTTIVWTDSYWTLPEIQDEFSWVSAISDIPQQIVDNLEAKIKNIPINDKINQIFAFTNKYLTINPIIDLKDLTRYLDLIFGSKEFNDALNMIKYIINYPKDDTSKTKEMLQLLGVDFQGGPRFKKNSVFANFTNWLNSPTSSLNTLIKTVTNDKTDDGILDNMLKTEKDLYHEVYTKYFDFDNHTYFNISNIKMDRFLHDDGSTSVILSYDIKNNLDNKSYSVKFKNNNFFKSKNFKLIFFHTN